MIHGSCVVPSLLVSSVFSSVTDKLERRKDSQEVCEAERVVQLVFSLTLKSWWGMDLHSSVLNGVLYAPTLL